MQKNEMTEDGERGVIVNVASVAATVWRDPTLAILPVLAFGSHVMIARLGTPLSSRKRPPTSLSAVTLTAK